MSAARAGARQHIPSGDVTERMVPFFFFGLVERENGTWMHVSMWTGLLTTYFLAKMALSFGN